MVNDVKAFIKEQEKENEELASTFFFFNPLTSSANVVNQNSRYGICIRVYAGYREGPTGVVSDVGDIEKRSGIAPARLREGKGGTGVPHIENEPQCDHCECATMGCAT